MLATFCCEMLQTFQYSIIKLKLHETQLRAELYHLRIETINKQNMARLKE